MEGAPVSLADSARDRMRASRELVERAAHGTSEHTYGINTGFGRFVSAVDPGGADRGAPAAAPPQSCLRRRRALRAGGRARGDAAARERAREGLLGRARRDGRAPARVHRTAACCRTCRAAARSARAATSHRSRTSRCRSSARGRPGSRASCLPGGVALERAGLEPVRLAGEGGALARSTGRSSWRRSARSGSFARGGSRRRPISRARCRSRRCRVARELHPEIQALRPLRGQAASAANVLRLIEDSAINESHRWCDKVQDAYSLRCAPQVHGACRDLLDYVELHGRRRAERGNRQPARARRATRMLVSNGNFHGQPVAFALDTLAMAVAELASISERRVERLVNPSLSDGLPPFLTDRRRAQLRVHDPAVRRGVAREREQGALAPGERRLDPDERGPGGSRLDGERGRAQGVAGARERRACARDRAARRRAGGRVPRAARAGCRRARDARVRANAVAAARRRPVAERRHRGGRGGDSQRLVDRGRRVRGRGAL